MHKLTEHLARLLSVIRLFTNESASIATTKTLSS
jgi:hypothetical protein